MSINLVPICKYNMKYNVQYKHAKYLNKQFTTSSHSFKHITSKSKYMNVSFTIICFVLELPTDKLYTPVY